MKVKTSLTLSDNLLHSVDRLIGKGVSRSSFIEDILWAFVNRKKIDEREAREIAIINRNADRLNEEMSDVLSFQAE
jgi:metal-responsive CopG/Arc/MetJ family transcriptional regulator